MQKFRLKRKVEGHGSSDNENLAAFEDIDDPRRRIQLALDELYQLNTKAEIDAALTRGLQFSHEGFAKRIRVGTGTFRVTNSDLFEKVRDRLLVLERVAGQRLRGQAAKGKSRPQESRTKSIRKVQVSSEGAELQRLREENRIQKQLLINAQEEILDLVLKLSMALKLPNN
ncbi:hypothetical protein ASG03_19545 [Rhizobium sp. Leaf341]|nr:hypothetical protein ASG03_19545 [Rhizobium sp. Leaf341]